MWQQKLSKTNQNSLKPSYSEGLPDMARSILDNPKSSRKLVVDRNEKDGFITKYWQRKVKKSYESIIPSGTPSERQIWLNSSEDILGFLDKLESPDTDFSSIEYVCIPGTISDIYDIVDFLSNLKNKLPDHAKLIYSNYNWKLEYLFKLSALIGFSKKGPWGNFYRDDDLDCFLEMSGWENVQRINRYILPFEVGIIGKIIDLVAKLPFFRNFSLNTIFIARKKNEFVNKEHSVTVLVPCRNEEGNIEAIIKRMPEFGKSLEILFINDKDTDNTEEQILRCQKEYSHKNIRLIHGPGKGKCEAVWEGMKYATGDICMILDADISVIPEDLPQFYYALNSRRADFLHGTRMVYPQEGDAMRPANLLGNIFFSILFSYILNQRITDTLCGTKVFWRRDWHVFEEMKNILKNIDMWGDYNLIFGAARFGLKIGELPVRYFQRLEGLTKVTKRIKNGLTLLRIAWYAFWEIKFLG